MYHDPVSRGFITGYSAVTFIVTFPLVLLGPLGSLIRFLLSLPILGLWELLNATVRDHLLLNIVPSLYNIWNSRVYPPLESSEQMASMQKATTIRLVHILPDLPGMALRVQICTASRDGSIYDALSYTWGSHFMLRRIIQANNSKFLITDSLYRALRELRNEKERRTIWIDALCINQYDPKEKERQVAIMRNIFQNAQKVYVWLGEAPQYLGDAFKIIERLANADSDHIPSICAENSNAWHQALGELLLRKWWSRVWIVEEVALPRESDVVIRSGHHELPWAIMSRFLKKSDKVPDLKIDRKILDFIDLLAEIRSPSYAGPEHGLLTYALRFRHRVAVRPVDKLFGFLGLLKSDISTELTPNYRKSRLDVFIDFSLLNVQVMKNLSIMTLAEACPVTGHSWAIDWESLTSRDWKEYDRLDSYQRHSDLPNMFWNGGLLYSDIAALRSYDSAGSLESSCEISSESWHGQKLLLVEGWIADTVAVVGPCFTEHDLETHIDSCIKFAGGPWTELTGERPQAFLRTIVGDAWREDLLIHWPSQDTLDRLSGRSTWVKGAATTRGAEDLGARDGKPLLDSERTLAQRREFQRRALTYLCCFQRHFFITKSGRFGLGPTSMEVGDSVCVLLGSQVPLILENQRRSWMFKGQAYVHGLMDYEGDLKHDIESQKIVLKEFKLS
ncbi:hypothetical protein ACLMJK_009087 [Lecanora helva]